MSGEAGGRAWGAREDNWWGAAAANNANQGLNVNANAQQSGGANLANSATSGDHHSLLPHEEARAVATAASTGAHHLFSYKMASGFQQQQQQQQQQAGAGGGSPPAAYDYRLGMGRPPEAHWWYSGVDALHSHAPLALHAHSNEHAHQQNQNQQHSTQNSQQNQQNQQTLQQQNQTLQQQIQSAQQQLQSAQQQQLQSQQLQSQQLQSQLQSQQLHLQQGLQHLAQGQVLQAAHAAQQKGRSPKANQVNCKPRGRITAYAFFVQTCREEHKKKHPDENVIFADFSKKCAERWKTMVDKEKQRFHEMAERDKKRYDLEMQTYIPPKGDKLGRSRKRKQMKDPNAPKRSLSAFFWFCNDERSKVKALNPEYGVGNIAKELGRRWADCDPETKAKYEAMSEKDKARYDREMTAYKKKPKSVTPMPEEEEEEPEDEEFD